jgi:hypothetical protein
MLGMTGRPEKSMKGALCWFAPAAQKAACETVNNQGLSVKPNYLEALLA